MILSDNITPLPLPRIKGVEHYVNSSASSQSELELPRQAMGTGNINGITSILDFIAKNKPKENS